MGKFTKTNQTILKDGSNPFQDSQRMGGTPATNDGNRLTNAASAVDANDYVIKQDFDPHTHTGFSPVMHDNTQHSPTLAIDGHEHYTQRLTEADGYVTLGALSIQWGRQTVLASTTADIVNNLWVPFHHAFPVGCMTVSLCAKKGTAATSYVEVKWAIKSVQSNGCYVDGRRIFNNPAGGNLYLTYIAWGH